MRSVFLPTQYGWTVTYWLTIEGIPGCFAEQALEHTALASQGWVKRALIIDNSSEVGQEVDFSTGIGRGLPLTFKLEDIAEVRALMRKPAKVARLKSPLSSSETTIQVDDNTAFADAEQVVWIGAEAIRLSGKTGTDQLDVAERGVYGSLPTPHDPGSVASLVTDAPRWWRGRQVRLWAIATHPTGFVVGNDLADIPRTSQEIWRGFIDVGPKRVGGLWAFDCLSLDRILDRPVSPPLVGTSGAPALWFKVRKAWSIRLKVQGHDGSAVVWGYTFDMQPFVADGDDTWLSLPDCQARLTAAFAAAMASTPNSETTALDAATHLNDLQIVPQGPLGSLQTMVWRIVAPTDPYLSYMLATLELNSGVASNVTIDLHFAKELDIHTAHGNPFAYNGTQTLQNLFGGDFTAVAITVEFETPLLALPQKASVAFSGPGGDQSEQANFLYLVSPTEGVTSFAGSDTIPVGTQLTLSALYPDNVSIADMMLAMLECSGEGGHLRGAHDFLFAGSGYGLSGKTTEFPCAIDTASFAINPPLLAAWFDGGVYGKSFAEIFGGALVLGDLAVVAEAHPIDRTVQLRLVSTAPAGSDWTATVVDKDLLVDSQPPAQLVVREGAPINALVVKYRGGDGAVIAVSDTEAQVMQGGSEQECNLPIANQQPDDANTITAIAIARFARSQFEQLIELRIAPWAADIRIGDVIQLDISHYALWDWVKGQEGYHGPARVYGKRMRLNDGACSILCRVAGQAPAPTLCPATEVLAFAGDPDAPTSITVDLNWQQLMQLALDNAGGPVKLLVYEPGNGNEDGGGLLTVDTAAVVSGQLVMSVTAADGVLLTADSWVTWPKGGAIYGGGDCSAWQEGFAHVADGSVWG